MTQVTYLQKRTLDRKTKELCQTVVLAALRSDTDHIAPHIIAAMNHGVTRDEVLEALEWVVDALGWAGLWCGVGGMGKVVGLKELEPAMG